MKLVLARAIFTKSVLKTLYFSNYYTYKFNEMAIYSPFQIRPFGISVRRTFLLARLISGCKVRNLNRVQNPKTGGVKNIDIYHSK